MKTEIIEFHETEIYCPVEDGQVYVAIKPICKALGISNQGQQKQILKDEILGQLSTTRLTVGGDEKQREMLCLPLQYIFGWLFRIDINKVKSDSKENLIKYQKECYDVLYSHFVTNASRYKQRDRQIIKLQDEVESHKRNKTLLTKQIKEKEAQIKEMLRTDPNQTDLFLDSDNN